MQENEKNPIYAYFLKYIYKIMSLFTTFINSDSIAK